MARTLVSGLIQSRVSMSLSMAASMSWTIWRVLALLSPAKYWLDIDLAESFAEGAVDGGWSSASSGGAAWVCPRARGRRSRSSRHRWSRAD